MRFLCPWDFPGKNTGVGCHFFLQGIFPTQGSNLGSPAFQADSLQSEPPGKPWIHRRTVQTEELYKNELHDPDNHDGVITHLEPDILKCKVKWALGSITMNKASGGNGILVYQFQILKDDTVKVLHAIYQQIWKTEQWPQDRKRSVFNPIPKKGNAKECWNYCTIVLISHDSKVMLKILQARLQQYVNQKLPDIQAGFRKGTGIRDQIASTGS